MTESTRHLVQKSLDHALDAALPVLRARTQPLPPETQLLALRCAEGIRTCLRDLSEAPTPAVQEALVRLIFSHAQPELVSALKEFAEVLNWYLAEAKDRIQARAPRRDS